MVDFSLEVSQNKYLPEGSGEVHAVITVTAHDVGPGTSGSAGTAGSGAAAGAAEVILLDCSGSMDYPHSKIIEARRAAQAAIDTLRDGVAFAVVEGTGHAAMVYPARQQLVEASPRTREAAKAAVKRLQPRGGTAMGRWLLLARDLMATRPDAIHHAILLTDGQNGESPAEFDAALAACEGRFQCDCRGVGADWKVAELRRVASTLLGGVALLREPAEMAQDFRSLVERAQARGIDRVGLRVWTPRGATVRFLRQVSPELEDLTGRAVEINPLTRDHPTGAWATGTREYHLCVDVPPAAVGNERLAARVSVIAGEEELSRTAVLAAWSEDDELSARIDEVVAHYTGQTELARAVQDGLAARRDGDEVSAVTLLGRAARIAAAADDGATLERLARVVDIDDAATGTVRLRPQVDALDEMDLDAGSTVTVPARR
ncbi:VWA domain-containing protein [Parafrankia discariae]|uniref:VWA domain-containing protein n=1 Tax=Parafrankia discariae TaxID=365528 RepID=UPI0003656684|nr:VWA domain-containing protein [Parafrankia discariae]